MTKTIRTSPATSRITATAEDQAIKARMSPGLRNLYFKCDALDADHMLVRTKYTAKCR